MGERTRRGVDRDSKLGKEDQRLIESIEEAESLSSLRRYIQQAMNSRSEEVRMAMVEALENGDVVIASDIPVLREVGGDYCIYFKENDVDDFSQKVVDLMHDKESYSTLREHISAYRVHTWDQTAEQVALLLRSGL